MTLLDVRDLLQFPPGENSSDVLIKGVHFNRTVLNYWNYTLWSNSTLSNGSNCFLVFDKYTPAQLLSNGTFINATSCYDPIHQIKTRGILGLVAASLFAVSIMFTLMNLNKHGRKYLPSEKRFKPIGRRWQWYWMLFLAACGMIAGITGIDIDRNYLQRLAIILQNFFFFLMQDALLAAVWEGVRHWGSFQERKLHDVDPFAMRQDDRRSRIEFWLPLIFYLFIFLNFFMVVPRSWTPFEYQGSPDQLQNIARPAATNARFKAGAIFSFLAWCAIVYSLRHSIHYYKDRNRGLQSKILGFLKETPTKFKLIVPLALIKIGYFIALAFDWDISPLKATSNPGWYFGFGFGTDLLIIAIFEVYGFIERNEDLVIIRARRERGASIDAELGIHKRPNWWSQHVTNRFQSDEDRLKAMSSTVGDGVGTSRSTQRNIELDILPRVPMADADGIPIRERPVGREGDSAKALKPREASATPTDSSGERSVQNMSSRPSQQIRSMLDV